MLLSYVKVSPNETIAEGKTNAHSREKEGVFLPAQAHLRAQKQKGGLSNDDK